MPLRKSSRPTYLLFGSLLALMVGRIAWADIPYEVTFTPTGDSALDAAIEAASQLSALADRPPDSEAALRSRVADDRERLNAVARAYSYYDDKVDIAIDVKAKPVKVTVTVTPGPQYILASVAIVGPDGKLLPDEVLSITTDSLGLKVGGPALSAPVAGANGKIEHTFQEHGYPFARILQRKVTVNHYTHQMAVTYEIDPGPRAAFGQTSFRGLETVHEAYVARRLHWLAGDPYDVTLVDKTRDALIASNLFSTVQITTEKGGDPGVTPMLVDVTERLPRSIAAGASYASTEGVSFNASWIHRNLFGEAEELKFGILVGQEESALTADFRKPDFAGVGWDLVSNIAVRKENANAYTSNGERVFSGLEYRGVQEIALGVGISLEHATISDFELHQHYTLVGIPIFAKRDTSDDLLNPTRGGRTAITITPYTDPARTQLSFVSGRINGSYYQRLGDSDRYILAVLGAIGATVGVSLDQLPKDKRFYVGGGGSVRGYGFQRAGPLGSHSQPLGGLSSVEASLELRYKLTETIGIVPFLDAGNVYDSNFPDLSRRLFLGAGIGLRYYTGLGPVRVDVATPLHQRSGDGPLQIYVSLGQAF
ncbi:MAG: rane protein [Rhodospirillales bacterium]|nr:rane protein [Rhodospirillales bacterium]